MKAIDKEVTGLWATSLAEAVASLEWARHEILVFSATGEPDAGQRLVCALIDGALNVLRRKVDAGVPSAADVPIGGAA